MQLKEDIYKKTGIYCLIIDIDYYDPINRCSKFLACSFFFNFKRKKRVGMSC